MVFDMQVDQLEEVPGASVHTVIGTSRATNAAIEHAEQRASSISGREDPHCIIEGKKTQEGKKTVSQDEEELLHIMLMQERLKAEGWEDTESAEALTLPKNKEEVAFTHLEFEADFGAFDTDEQNQPVNVSTNMSHNNAATAVADDAFAAFGDNNWGDVVHSQGVPVPNAACEEQQPRDHNEDWGDFGAFDDQDEQAEATVSEPNVDSSNSKPGTTMPEEPEESVPPYTPMTEQGMIETAVDKDHGLAVQQEENEPWPNTLANDEILETDDLHHGTEPGTNEAPEAETSTDASMLEALQNEKREIFYFPVVHDEDQSEYVHDEADSSLPGSDAHTNSHIVEQTQGQQYEGIQTATPSQNIQEHFGVSDSFAAEQGEADDEFPQGPPQGSGTGTGDDGELSEIMAAHRHDTHSSSDDGGDIPIHNADTFGIETESTGIHESGFRETMEGLAVAVDTHTDMPTHDRTTPTLHTSPRTREERDAIALNMGHTSNDTAVSASSHQTLALEPSGLASPEGSDIWSGTQPGDEHAHAHTPTVGEARKNVKQVFDKSGLEHINAPIGGQKEDERNSEQISSSETISNFEADTGQTITHNVSEEVENNVEFETEWDVENTDDQSEQAEGAEEKQTASVFPSPSDEGPHEAEGQSEAKAKAMMENVFQSIYEEHEEVTKEVDVVCSTGGTQSIGAVMETPKQDDAQPEEHAGDKEEIILRKHESYSNETASMNQAEHENMTESVGQDAATEAGREDAAADMLATSTLTAGASDEGDWDFETNTDEDDNDGNGAIVPYQVHASRLQESGAAHKNALVSNDGDAPQARASASEEVQHEAALLSRNLAGENFVGESGSCQAGSESVNEFDEIAGKDSVGMGKNCPELDANSGHPGTDEDQGDGIIEVENARVRVLDECAGHVHATKEEDEEAPEQLPAENESTRAQNTKVGDEGVEGEDVSMQHKTCRDRQEHGDGVGRGTDIISRSGSKTWRHVRRQGEALPSLDEEDIECEQVMGSMNASTDNDDDDAEGNRSTSDTCANVGDSQNIEPDCEEQNEPLQADENIAGEETMEEHQNRAVDVGQEITDEHLTGAKDDANAEGIHALDESKGAACDPVGADFEDDIWGNAEEGSVDKGAREGEAAGAVTREDNCHGGAAADNEWGDFNQDKV